VRLQDPRSQQRNDTTQDKQIHVYTMTTRNDSSASQPSLTFGSDPVAYLEAIARAVPSKELLSRLAGPVASAMKDVQTTAFAPLYLRAVAQQLAAETGTAAASASASASALGPSVMNHGKVEVEAEMKSVHQIYEIAEVRSDLSTL
jgi:hypothetical protein